MKIAKIKISNILGIKEIEIEPGHITEISGRNGTGKTSIIEAIRGVIGGGRVSQLLRNGAESAEVILELDDGTEIKKGLSPDKAATLRVKKEELGTIGRGQSFIDGIHDSLGVNPVELISADPARRGKLVLEAMPMTVELDKLQNAVGDAMGLTPGIERGHALTAIAKVTKLLYNKRTDINREGKQKSATLNQLRESVPDDGMDAKKLQAEIGQLEGFVSDADTDIEQARLRFEQEVEDRKLDRAKSIAEIRALEERLKAAERDANTLGVITGLEGEVGELTATSINLTNAMDRVEAIQEDLMDNLPLPVTIGEDGEVYSNGVPFATLNSAKKIELALRLAALRAGELGLICVDGLEMLDAESYDSFREWALKRPKLNFIVTRVSDGPLSVRTYP